MIASIRLYQAPADSLMNLMAQTLNLKLLAPTKPKPEHLTFIKASVRPKCNRDYTVQVYYPGISMYCESYL